MPGTLHITNGDSVVHSWRDAQLPGDYLAWRDPMEVGPVPGGLSFHELTDRRARFIAECGWAPLDDVRRSFQERDHQLRRCREYDEVCLWFEHDLHDQLQLIRLLDFFANEDLGPTQLNLICLGEYPNIQPFYGLGQLTGQQLLDLYPTRHPVLDAELDVAKTAWAAFTADDPARLVDRLYDDLTPLPFLLPALRRHLQQFPSVRNGLNRTEQQIVEILAVHPTGRLDLYHHASKREDVPFGDWIFWLFLDGLRSEPNPLVHGTDDRLELTGRGRSVLEGRSDWVDLHPPDRWLGGAHLQPGGPVWRWDDERTALRT